MFCILYIMDTNQKRIVLGSLLALIVLGALAAFVYKTKDRQVEVSGIVNNSPGNSTSSTSPEQAFSLKPVSVQLENGKKFSVNIPKNYSFSVAAQGFRRARFMDMSPDGRLFFGDMASASDARTGKVYVLDGFDEASGKFKTQTEYLNNLRNPNSLAFYKDTNGKNWIYIALTDKLVRYPYSAGDTAPSAPEQVIAIFPDTPHNPPQGYWHITRTVIFHANTLYVSVGSSCDSCEENEALRAVIVKMDPDGKNQKIIASGLRNAVGIGFAGNDLLATVNGSDALGKDKPQDVMYKIEEGDNYGWPYCYEFAGGVYENDTQKWNKKFDCSKVPVSWVAFASHSAPLGFEYFGNNFADPFIKNSVLAALHGSGQLAIGHGNSVSMVREHGEPVEFINGLLQNGTRLARAVDIFARDNNSFFVTDDFNGAVYYLRYSP